MSELIIHQIFSLGYYLFLKAHSFFQATVLETCLLPVTDNVWGQIIFIGAFFCAKCRLLFIYFHTKRRLLEAILQIFFARHTVLKIGEYHLNIPQFLVTWHI